VETRELRYFVAVAEERHFGRAAERLGIAQPPLSRAIAALERRLGARLFERTTREVALTDAGAVLLAEGRAALDAVLAAEQRTRRAAHGPGIVLVAKAGASAELLAKLLDAYAAEPGAVEVDVQLCAVHQAPWLRSGRADVGLLHRPYDDLSGFDTEDLLSEGQSLFVPRGHPLASRTEFRTSELADLPLPRWPRPDGGYPDGPGPEVRDLTQLRQLISLDRAIAVLPDSIRQGGDDLVGIPVVDAEPVTTLIAWPPHSRSRAVADLVRCATRL
jgi:LysR family transcriptional regulator, benzoate and cis,cis-muconate-responsive activator of ben and cat genes